MDLSRLGFQLTRPSAKVKFPTPAPISYRRSRVRPTFSANVTPYRVLVVNPEYIHPLSDPLPIDYLEC